MTEDKRWYCDQPHREDITERVLEAMNSGETMVFRFSRAFWRKKRARRLQVRCSEGHLNIVPVDPDS